MYIKFSFCLYSFNRECMERNVMTSFRILSSFECFLCYFQIEWSGFFTLQCELFTSCNVSNNASLVSARTGRKVCQPNVYRPGQREGGPKNSQICEDILYGWPLPSEAVVRRCFLSRFFLTFSQCSHENTRVRVSFS